MYYLRGWNPTLILILALINSTGVCHVYGSSERDRRNIKQSLVHSYNTAFAPKVKAACIETATVPIKNTHPLREHSRYSGRVCFLD